MQHHCGRDACKCLLRRMKQTPVRWLPCDVPSQLCIVAVWSPIRQVHRCIDGSGHAAGTHFACKTIPKIPKRGKGTPRYLLKLQTEVDAMVQLGPSLDAVYLKV